MSMTLLSAQAKLVFPLQPLFFFLLHPPACRRCRAWGGRRDHRGEEAEPDLLHLARLHPWLCRRPEHLASFSLLHNRWQILRISSDFLEIPSFMVLGWHQWTVQHCWELEHLLLLLFLQPPFALFNFPFIPNVTKCKIGSHCAFKIFLCRLNLQGLIILKSASRSCQNAVCSIPRKVLRVGTSN